MPERKEVRSVRVTDTAWSKGRKRALKEGVSMSHVVNELVEGYASGDLSLPRIEKHFDQPAK